MDPNLVRIREQLPNESVSFALFVRGFVAEGKPSAFAEAARAITDEAQKEPGCISYRFFFSGRNKREYVLFENWQNFPAFAAHSEKSYVRRFSEETKKLTDGPPAIELLIGQAP